MITGPRGSRFRETATRCVSWNTPCQVCLPDDIPSERVAWNALGSGRSGIFIFPSWPRESVQLTRGRPHASLVKAASVLLRVLVAISAFLRAPARRLSAEGPASGQRQATHERTRTSKNSTANDSRLPHLNVSARKFGSFYFGLEYAADFREVNVESFADDFARLRFRYFLDIRTK